MLYNGRGALDRESWTTIMMMSEPSSQPGPLLSGQLFSARMEYLLTHYGPGAVTRVLEALPDEDRELLKGLDRGGWYPFATLVRFDREVARLVVPGDPGIFERLGAASSRLRNEWLGEHASLVHPHAFLSRVADEHWRYHTFGAASYRRTGFNEGEISFSEYPELDEVYCLGARGYLRASVELLTNGPVSIEERRCQCRGDDACVFWIHWAGRAETPEPQPPTAG